MAVRGSRDQRIAQIAGRQHGRISRAQMLAAGITDHQIKAMLKAGRIYRRHHGVYAVGHNAPVELGQETAALLAAPEGAVISHGTAAVLWGLRPADPNAPIELVSARGSHLSDPGIVLHRTRHLPTNDLRVRKGLPVTAPARTLADLASQLPDRELERALDEAIIQRLVRTTELRDVTDRLPTRPGTATLKRLIEDRTGTTRTRSQAEERFLALIRAAQLPMPELNVRLHGFSVDFYWRRENVVVEVDGYRFHSTRSAFERDHRKSGVLRAAGIDLHRITWDQMDREPFALIARVTAALQRTNAP